MKCIWSHEIVDHFRTRADPEVEKMIKGMKTEAEQVFGGNLNDAKNQADKLGQVYRGCENFVFFELDTEWLSFCWTL